MHLLNKFENKYIIKGTLKTLSAIHIGAGNIEFSPTAVDNCVVRDEDNNPYIPGSSLKGVVRSFTERLLYSGVFNEYRSCIITDKHCVDDNKIKEIKNKYKNKPDSMEQIATEIYEAQCDVCRLFGGKNFASKIQIKDAKLKENKAIVTQRNGVTIDRDTLTAVNGRKYEFESVAAGTKFNFEMTIDNIDDNHITLLKIIVNYLSNGNLTIGGKLSAGLGSVALENYEIYSVNKENMREFFIKGITEENKKSFVKESL